MKVALVDDHKVVTEGLRRFFESFADIEITGTASSGEDLLKRIPSWPVPDVVVLDLLMPGGMDGVETTRRLIQAFPEVRVVALTASTDEARMNAVLRAGATGYVRKDADPEFLLSAVRAVARGLSFIDPTAAGSMLQSVATPDVSTREAEVLREVAFGRTNREIGERLYVSEETIKTHVGNLLSKLGLQNRTQLAAFALKNRLVDIEELLP